MSASWEAHVTRNAISNTHIIEPVIFIITQQNKEIGVLILKQESKKRKNLDKKIKASFYSGSRNIGKKISCKLQHISYA